MITDDQGIDTQSQVWPDPVLRALVVAARAFADELERGIGHNLPAVPPLPAAGSAESMIEVLGSVVRINDESGRGAENEEMREIAKAAGMDPRGIAGYYNAGLLEKRTDGTRWILPAGRERLERLAALRNVHLLANDD